ncbi:MAG: hypothetical protein N2748_06650, partial [candidate division WOR-3 bacterium]|nr:hypothetical protein [candidate division WOR-3 bacterium]
MKIRNFRYSIIMCVLGFCWIFISCPKQMVLSDSENNSQINFLYPFDSLLFSPPLLKFCPMPDNFVLAIDVSQEKIYRLKLNSKKNNGHFDIVIDTFILPQKFNLLKNIAADNFYIYLCTENTIYQYDLIKQNITVKFNDNKKIRISGIAITAEGEIFILDDFNRQILYIDNLGRINKFNVTAKNLFIPVSIAYDRQANQLLIINQAQNRIESYSKIGNLQSIIELPCRYPTCLLYTS